MSHTIVAHFDTRWNAEHAEMELLDHGFRREAIKLIGIDTHHRIRAMWEASRTHAFDVTVGAVFSAVMGAILGTLVGFMVLFLPGIGLSMSMSDSVGLIPGAIIGGIVGLALGVIAWSRSIADDSTLLTAEVDEVRDDEVIEIMKHNAALDEEIVQ